MLNLHANQLVLIGKARDLRGSRFGDQHLLFEFHALSAPFFADIALYAHHHAWLQDALPAVGLVIHGVSDERRLAVHSHAMHDGSIALVDEALGNLPGLLGDLAEG